MGIINLWSRGLFRHSGEVTGGMCATSCSIVQFLRVSYFHMVQIISGPNESYPTKPRRWHELCQLCLSVCVSTSVSYHWRGISLPVLMGSCFKRFLPKHFHWLQSLCSPQTTSPSQPLCFLSWWITSNASRISSLPSISRSPSPPFPHFNTSKDSQHVSLYAGSLCSMISGWRKLN